MEACVIDGPEPVINDEVRFSVEIGNICLLDSLVIQPRGLVPYWLRTPEEPHFDKITIVQTYAFCPFECTLNSNNMGQMQPWSRDIFDSWNPFSGEFTILTGDKSLAEQMMFMMVSCSSTLSNNQTPAMSAFPIAF